MIAKTRQTVRCDQCGRRVRESALHERITADDVIEVCGTCADELDRGVFRQKVALWGSLAATAFLLLVGGFFAYVYYTLVQLNYIPR